MSEQNKDHEWELDDRRLKWVLANVSIVRCRELASLLVAVMIDLKLDRAGAAAFLATLAHESGDFRWLEEQASGAAYEGRKDLGNNNPGDGVRFKGRGPLQLTGRANYRAAGEALGLDLVGFPGQVSRLDVGLECAAWFWRTHNLAAESDFKRVTRVVNGGLNGWDSRLKYYNRALEALKATT